MKDRWLDDINKKMSGFETNEPAGLWQNIEAGHHGQAPSLHSGLMKTLHAWQTWVVAAVVGATTGLTVLLADYGQDTPKLEASAEAIAQTETGTPKTDPESGVLSQNDYRFDETTEKHTSIGHNSELRSSQRNGLYQSGASDRDVTDPVSHIKNNEVEKKVGDPSVKHTESTQDSGSEGKPTKKKRSATSSSSNVSIGESKYEYEPGGFSVGAYTSGRFGGGDVVNGGLKSEPSGVTVNPMSESFNRVSHNMPIRLGVSFAWYATSRLSLETGLVYTRLGSTFENGVFDNFYCTRAKQTLNYIGVPVNLNYRFATWNIMTFYGSAGVMGEKLISGKFLGENGAERRSFGLSEKVLQWSINAGIGAQLNVSRTVGIYLEPGVVYYFDNKSEIKNVYKDRPVNFDLEMGVRVIIK